MRLSDLWQVLQKFYDSGLSDRQNQRAFNSSRTWKLWRHMLNFNWAIVCSEKPEEGGLKIGSLTLRCFVFPHTVCQRESKVSLKPSNWEWERVGGRRCSKPFLFCFVSDVYTCCLSWLTTSAASATTTYWLNDDIYSSSVCSQNY